MIPMLRSLFTSIRVWLGWNDPSANHPHPAHGWLLSDALAPVPAVKPQPLGRKR